MSLLEYAMQQRVKLNFNTITVITELSDIVFGNNNIVRSLNYQLLVIGYMNKYKINLKKPFENGD